MLNKVKKFGKGGAAIVFTKWFFSSSGSDDMESMSEKTSKSIASTLNDMAATIFKHVLYPSTKKVVWMPRLVSQEKIVSQEPSETTTLKSNSKIIAKPMEIIFDEESETMTTPPSFLPKIRKYIKEKTGGTYGDPEFIEKFAKSSGLKSVDTDMGSYQVLNEPTEMGEELGQVISQVHTTGAKELSEDKKRKAFTTSYVEGSENQHFYLGTITTYNPELYKKLQKNKATTDAKIFKTWFGSIPGLPGVVTPIELFTKLVQGPYDKRYNQNLSISSTVSGDEESVQKYFPLPKPISTITDFPRQVFNLLGNDVVHCSSSLIRFASGDMGSRKRFVALQMNTWPGYHSLAGVLIHGHYVDESAPGYVTRIILGRGWSEGFSDRLTQSFADCLNVPAGLTLWFGSALMQDVVWTNRTELEKRYKCKIYNLADKVVVDQFPVKDDDGEILCYQDHQMPWWWHSKDLIESTGGESLWQMQRLFYMIGAYGTPGQHKVNRNVIPYWRTLFGMPKSIMGEIEKSSNDEDE